MKKVSEHQLSFIHAIKYYAKDYPVNTGGLLRLFDENNINKVRHAIKDIILSEGVFHTKFTYIDNEVYQYEGARTCELDFLDFSQGLNMKIVNDYFEEPLDYKNKLYKVALIKEERHISVLFVMHHLISDSITLHLVVSKLLDYLDNGVVNSFDSYDSYLKREDAYLNSPRFKIDEEYWRNAFSVLKNTYVKPHFNGKRLDNIINKKVSLTSSQTNQIDKFLSLYGGSPQTLFELLVGAELSLVNDFEEVTLGITTHNRKRNEFRVAGMVAATLPLTIKLDKKDSIINNYQKIALSHLKIYRHQMYPYRHILELASKNGVSNLFDAMVIFHKPYEKLYRFNYELTTLVNKKSLSGLLLNIEKRSPHNNYVLSFDFKESLFNTTKEQNQYINRLLLRLKLVLKNPSAPLETLITNNYENEVILRPQPQTILELFAGSVSNNYNNIAVKNNKSIITYQELNRLSDQISKKLQKMKLNKVVIEVSLSDDINSIAAMLGILKSNNTFVFLPKGINKQLTNIYHAAANIKFVITDDFLSNLTNEIPIKINRTNEVLGIYFTSGSSGIPKAVQVMDLGILNYILQNKGYQKDVKDCSSLINLSPFSFDISLENIMLSLLNGKTLILGYLDSLSDKYLLNHDFISTTPSILQLIINHHQEILKTMKVIVAGGEVLGVNLVNNLKALTTSAIYNSYGPTEASIAVMYHKVDNDDISLGKSFSGCEITIRNNDNLILPDGYIGQIFISGICLSAGNITNQNQSGFISINHKRYYQTGDYGYINSNNNLVFVGRKDMQIKRNGVRIDLKQIDNTLLNNTSIIQSKTSVINDKIITNIVSNDLSENDVYEILLEHLPQMYLPNRVIISNNVLINDHGKTHVLNNFLVKQAKYEPQNEFEEKFINILAESLDVNNLTTSDSIYNIGADSINVLSFIIKLDEALIKLPISMLYEVGNIVKVMKKLQENKEEDEEEIRFHQLTNNINNDEVKHILLFGATGFLGAHVLNNLLKNQKFSVSIIIRNQSNKDGLSYLNEIYHYYFKKRIDFKRVNVLVSNLTEPQFGLDNTLYQTLIKQVDLVINCAAKVDYIGALDEYQVINVDLVKEIIKFIKARSIPIFHTSTIGLLVNYKDPFDEMRVLTTINQTNYYLSTKQEAEELLFSYKKDTNNLVYNFRLGNLMPRSKDFKFQVNQENNAIYQIAKRLSLDNNQTNQTYQVDMTPIDYASSIIVDMINKRNSLVTYHLYAPYVIYLNKDKKFEIKDSYEFILNNQTTKALKLSQIKIPKIPKTYLFDVLKSWKL